MTSPRTVGLFLAIAVTTLLCAPRLDAFTLLVSDNPSNVRFGSSQWQRITDKVTAQVVALGGQIVYADNVINAAQVMAADAIWVDDRTTSGSLTAIEIANLGTFIASGRRIVLMGENLNFATWNSQILSVVGGTAAPVNTTVISITPISVNPLTTGVTEVRIATAGLAIGGTQLFNHNVITLWGAASNALTILDSNIFTETGGPVVANTPFFDNVASWITTPEPSRGLLLLLSFVASMCVRRKSPPAV